ncbi:MAG: GNAT family N-acetyltransferase [Gemmatimonadales bacterium]
MSVTHDIDRLRFVATAAGGEAELHYSFFTDGVINLEHTEVPTAARGLGLADALIRAALAYARAEGYGVMATCPFAQRWLAAHPDERPRKA